jgi:hypothetical protein
VLVDGLYCSALTMMVLDGGGGMSWLA